MKDPSGIVRSPWMGFGTLEILTAREVDALHDKDDLARRVVSVAASMAVAIRYYYSYALYPADTHAKVGFPSTPGACRDSNTGPLPP